VTAARSAADEAGKNLEMSELAGYSSQAWDVLRMLRPYLGNLVLLALAAVFLSFLSGTTQIALTPLLEIVLGDNSPVTSTAPTFDLNQIGLSILSAVAHLTGETNRWRLLLIITGVYLILALVGQAAAFGTRVWAVRVRLNIARDLEHRLFGHILRLPLSFLNRHQTGWLQSRMITDVNASLESINTLIIDGLSSSLLSLFYVYLLFVTSPRLTVIVGFAGLAQLLLSRGLTNLAKSRTRTSFEAGAQLLAFIQERFTVAREIKSLSGESYEQAGFWKMVSWQIKAAYRQFFLKHVEKPIRWSINRVIIVVVMLFGAWELFNGKLTTSGYLLFMFITQSLIGPLAALAAAYLEIEVIKTSLEGVSYILAQPEESGGSRPLPAEGFRQALMLENVSFAYEELPVLRGISLTIKKGEMVALVGRSGAGKTTLVDLLLRFFDPDSGRITLDGVPISEFDLYEYRRMFGVVSQDGALFNATVLSNIAYARPDLPHEAVKQAAEVANARDFILADLSDGYETVLGERGVRLSGGQRQRIAIARAVVHRPEILVLDEATSALDTESERLVQDAIARVVAGSTSIVIAHRLSTIRMADKIVVMKEGRIVEVGKHQELLDLGGEYSYLHDLQFQVEDAP
jgi:ABC-type multidrug transport system fused ATPase/permease subunit